MRHILKTALAAGTALMLTAGLAGPASAEIQKRKFSVVGTWGNLDNYKSHEQPFWSKTLPAASNGDVLGDIKSYTELGLSGYEPMRLLKSGVFDFAHALTSYHASDSPVIEGVDLAGVAPTIELSRKVTTAYKPILEQEFDKQFNAKLLMMYTFPSQNMWCKPEVKGIEDLEGLKIRTYSTTLGDFIEGLGASSVTIAFAEVVPALEKGVADCGITGTLPAYNAKWWQVVNTAYKLPLSWAVAVLAANNKTWDKMNGDTQAFMMKEIGALEDRMWAANAENDGMGIACNTSGPCPLGDPGGMTLVEPSAADVAKRQEILENLVLPRWASRCKADGCVDNWNATIGKVAGVTAKAN